MLTSSWAFELPACIVDLHLGWAGDDRDDILAGRQQLDGHVVHPSSLQRSVEPSNDLFGTQDAGGYRQVVLRLEGARELIPSTVTPAPTVSLMCPRPDMPARKSGPGSAVTRGPGHGKRPT